MRAVASDLPQFVRDLLSSPPKRGEGLNLWLFRTARVLHPYRPPSEIVQLLSALTADEPIKPGEIERAVERSAAVAWNPGQRAAITRARAWPHEGKRLLRFLFVSSPFPCRSLRFLFLAYIRATGNEAVFPT